MKTLHNITATQLPDIILAQIWIIQRSYRAFLHISIEMNKYQPMLHHRGPSCIYMWQEPDRKDHAYNWQWEQSRLTQWISAGRPQINMENVTINYA